MNAKRIMLIYIMIPIAVTVSAADWSDFELPAELSGFNIAFQSSSSYDKGKGEEDWDDLFFDSSLWFDYQDGPFFFASSMNIGTQAKYIGEQVFGPFQFHLLEGSLGFQFDQLYFAGGFQRLVDVVDTEYSLFATSQPFGGAPTIELSYEGDFFFATTQWFGLNLLSAHDYPDRGMNLRTLGFQFTDELRMGYIESVVYSELYFNPLYFFVPFPYQFVQLYDIAPGSPGASHNAQNTQAGLFAAYQDEIHYGFIQLLFDDFNPFTWLGVASEFTQKIAWSIGYSYLSDIGRFGIYHAGATKYVYQNPRDSESTSYSMYPANRYDTREGMKTIWYFDNYLGYKYGENALSFRFEYGNIVFKLWELEAGVEYVLSGSKSITDPWGTATASPGATQMLDDDVFEHTVSLDLANAIKLPNSEITVLLDATVGYVINEIELVQNDNAADTENHTQYTIFQPGDTSRLFFTLFVGGRIALDNTTTPWRQQKGLEPSFK